LNLNSLVGDKKEYIGDQQASTNSKLNRKLNHSSTNHNTKHNNTNTLTSWPWLPLHPQRLLPSIEQQVTHQHEDHRSVIPYCVSPTWAPMVMAAIRIKILHCAIAIACCRCHNCYRSIVIADPPSPPPLSRVVLSSPILFKYRHRSQRGRCARGVGLVG